MTDGGERSSISATFSLVTVSKTARIFRAITAIGAACAVVIGLANLRSVFDWNGFAGVVLMWSCIIGIFVVFVSVRMAFEPNEAVKLQQRVRDYAKVLARSAGSARHVRELRRDKAEVGADLLTALVAFDDQQAREAAERGFIELAIFQPLSRREVQAVAIHDRIYAQPVTETAVPTKIIPNVAANHEALLIAAAVIDRVLAEKAERAIKVSSLKSAVSMGHNSSTISSPL